MTREILLREVSDDDLPVFFAQQLDADAAYMAAFTARNPGDREAFAAHWATIRGAGAVAIRTILVAGQVAGHVLRFDEAGRPEVSYWLGKDYWGQGIATEALSAFLGQQQARPLYARAAKDNRASIRVLEKCGFTIVGEDEGFANARGAEVEEYILMLRANDGNDNPGTVIPGPSCRHGRCATNLAR